MKAGRLVDAGLQGDVDTMARGMCSIDRSESGISDDQAKRFIREIVLPRIKALKRIGTVKRSESPDKKWGFATISVKGPQGEFDHMAATVPTEEGPCMPLDDLLRSSWRAQAGGLLDARVLRDGLRQDQAKLREIGITRILGHDGKLRTLDELDALYASHVR